MNEWDRWRAAVRALTASPEARRAYRDQRFAFAHAVGNALRQWILRTGGDRPVVYAISLADGVPVYIGQTPEPSRRLYDLPIGESHHLANTYPPELWARIVVLDWTKVLDPREREIALHRASELLSAVNEATLGEAVEFELQRRYTPEMNLGRKLASGGWSSRNFARSRCAGAAAAPALRDYFVKLIDAFDMLQGVEGAAGEAIVELSCGVMLLPERLELSSRLGGQSANGEACS